MFIYIVTFIKWLFRKGTLSNALFGLRIAKELFSNKDAKNPEKNQAIIEKLEIAQDAIDRLQKLIPNKETEKYAKGINKSKDQKTWGDFSAKLVKDKHGKGNDGINLGLNTKVNGLDIEIGYDPKDGSAKVKIGPFGFNV